MTEVGAFERLVAGPCPPPGELLLALAAEFHPVSAASASFDLDELARALFAAAAAADPRTAALGLAELLTERERFRRDESSVDGLLLDSVLERRRGHPLALSVVAVEAGRRAGVDVAVCSAAAGWFAGIGEGGKMWLVDPAADPGPVPSGTVRRHCGHEVAFAALTGIYARLLVAGDELGARRAASLRDRLPVARHDAG